MLYRHSRGISLLELLFSLAIFSIITVAAYESLLKSVRVWGTNAQEVSLNFYLQMGINACARDMVKAKYTTIQLDQTNSTADSILFQTPVQYTETGADGKVGYFLGYSVITQNSKRVLVRRVYNATKQVVGQQLLAWGIDDKLDTAKTGVDAWKQKGFGLYVNATTKELYIYLRLATREASRHRELETKVFIRN